MKEMTTHSFCLALCPYVTLLLPSRTQTSGSASVFWQSEFKARRVQTEK